MFGGETEQRRVFDETVVPVLDGFIEGFNCTIVAYGQVLKSFVLISIT